MAELIKDFIQNFKGFIALLLAGSFFGYAAILIRFLSEEYTDLQQAMWRMLLAGFIAAAIASLVNLKRKTRPFLNLVDFAKGKFYLYLISFPLSIVMVTISINLISVATTIFFVYIGKLSSSIVFDLVFFNEKITRKKIISISFLLCGMLFFFDLSNITINLGIVLSTLAGILASTDGALKKVFVERMENWFLVSLQMVTGGLLVAFIILIKGETIIPTVSSHGVFLLVMFSILVVCTQVLMLVGFRRFGVNLGTIVLSSELVFAMIFGVIFLSEMPKSNEILGALFIIAAITNRNIKVGADQTYGIPTASKRS